MWKIRLAILLLVVSGVLACVSPVMSSNTASFTVTARGDIGLPQPPTNFTVTRITDTLVRVSWTPWSGSTNTSIRAKFDAEPTAYNDGYILFYGSGNETTDVYLNLDVMWSKMWYVAASENSSGGWSDYITEYVESPNVAEIANQLGGLNNVFSGIVSALQMGKLFEVLLVLGIFAIALWRKDKEANVETAIIFLTVSGLVTLYIALGWIATYQGVGLAMVGLGGYQLFEAVRLGLESGGASRGFAQFKGWWNKARGRED